MSLDKRSDTVNELHRTHTDLKGTSTIPRQAPPEERSNIGLIVAIILVIAVMGGLLYFGLKEQKPAVPVDAGVGGDPARMVQANGCMTCHRVDEKLIGPSWVQIAERYHGNAAMVPELVKKVRLGGKGVWGDVPMTAQPTLSSQEVDKMVRWILAEHAPDGPPPTKPATVAAPSTDTSAAP